MKRVTWHFVWREWLDTNVNEACCELLLFVFLFFVFLKCTNVLTRSSGITGSQCFIFFNHVHGFVQQQQKECLFGVALFLVGVCTGPALSALKSVVYQQVNRVCSYKCCIVLFLLLWRCLVCGIGVTFFLAVLLITICKWISHLNHLPKTLRCAKSTSVSWFLSPYVSIETLLFQCPNVIAQRMWLLAEIVCTTLCMRVACVCVCVCTVLKVSWNFSQTWWLVVHWFSLVLRNEWNTDEDETDKRGVHAVSHMRTSSTCGWFLHCNSVTPVIFSMIPKNFLFQLIGLPSLSLLFFFLFLLHPLLELVFSFEEAGLMMRIQTSTGHRNIFKFNDSSRMNSQICTRRLPFVLCCYGLCGVF